MKKDSAISNYCKGVSLVFLFFMVQFAPAQILSLSSPSMVCVNQTFTATVSSTYSAPLTYQWVIPGAIITNLNAQASQIAITFSTCSTKTITCIGYDANNNAVPGAIASQTVFVPCQPAPTVVLMAYSVCAGYKTTISAIPGAATGYTWLPGGSTQSTLSATAGNYTLISSMSPYGCLSSTVVNVGLAPPLSLIVTANGPTTCVTNNQPLDMKPVNLTVDGATNYTWTPYIAGQMTYPNDPEPIVRPTTSTCYTVTGTTSVCSGTAQICVTVVPQFSIDVVPVNPIICSGSSVGLGVNSVGGGPALPGYTYTWTDDITVPSTLSSNSGATVNAFPLNTATYTVEVLNTQNCISLPKIVTVNVAICTRLNDSAINETNIKIYPNPANDAIYISSEITREIDVEITNVLGERVSSEKVLIHTGSENRVDVSSLQKGLYFIKLDHEQSNGLIRFIKN